MVSERTSNTHAESGTDSEDGTQSQPVLERRIADRTDELEEPFENVPNLSIDKLLELLSHPGRRYVLTYLLGTEGHATCGELVDYVVTRTDSTMTPDQFRKRVASQFTHTHFPKLAGANLIDYNVERQIVERTETTEAVRPFLELSMAYGHRRTAADEE